jgi:hypothetical protein
MPSLNVTVRRYTNSTFLGLLVIAAAGVIIATHHSETAPQSSGSTTATLKVVATLRSVTVSPNKTAFSRCHGGRAPYRSTRSALGYPNGVCLIGNPGSRWPIVVTNGIRSAVHVQSTVATPEDGGTPWKLCNPAGHGVTCHGPGGNPGFDQFAVQNFSSSGVNVHGLTVKGACDVEFNSYGSCLALSGQIQHEGIRLIGPSTPGDNATTWHVTITWVAAPP